jgi:3,4-dihydroxy 2-butanone 4-phosphate synthase/GTP cyclohydrolase II
MVSTSLDVRKPVLVRIHSECLTGDVFGSARCDCGEQLEKSLHRIGIEGGVVVYLRQEGRGIGLVHKLRAYNLQDEGLNTADANTHLGFEVDERTYEDAVSILQDLGISEIRLMTNNPDKIDAFVNGPVRIAGREPIVISPRTENQAYLDTKKSLMGHLLYRHCWIPRPVSFIHHPLTYRV